jgi:hypothetical protein
MTFEAAEAALASAIGADNGDTGATPAEPNVPILLDGEQAPATTTPQGVESSAAPEAPEAPAEDTFSTFNPDTLPEELRPGWQQLQADYTRKTQELAAQRKQYESLGDYNVVQEAVQLQNWLQDPQNMQEAHAQLSYALEQMGLTPAQAEVAATQELQETAEPSGLASLTEDPELAPLAQHVQSLEAKLSELTSERDQRAEAARAQQLQQAMLGELTRQENFIRQANPAYTDNDVDAIYELGSFYDGDLIRAQARYEEIVNSRMSQYLAQKQAVVNTPGIAPVPGSAAIASPATGEAKTLDQAHKAAMEHLRVLEAQG